MSKPTRKSKSAKLAVMPLTCEQRALAAHIGLGELGKKVNEEADNRRAGECRVAKWADGKMGELGNRIAAMEEVKRRQGVLRLADALVICDLKERVEALEQAEEERIDQQEEDFELGLIGRFFRCIVAWFNAVEEPPPAPCPPKGKPTPADDWSGGAKPKAGDVVYFVTSSTDEGVPHKVRNPFSPATAEVNRLAREIAATCERILFPSPATMSDYRAALAREKGES